MKQTSRGFVAAGAVAVALSSFSMGTKAQAAPSTTTEAAKAKVPSYSDLRRSLKVDASLTLEMVRSNPGPYAGRVVEINGFVTGVVKSTRGQNAILNVSNSSVSLVLPSEFRDTGVLSSGNNVRVLALVGRVADAGNGATDVPLTPLAASPAPNAPAESTSTPRASSAGGSDSAIIALADLPPATEIPLVNQRPWTSAMRPSTPKAVPSGNSSAKVIKPAQPAPVSTFESQIPAYRAMILRHNARLTAIQVDQIATALLQAADANSMDPRFLAAVIAVESDFDIYCRSSSGAMGLGQIMPFNLREAGITNAWDPVQNVWGTARLLRGHLNTFARFSEGTLLAVAAYNAGPNAVKRAGNKVPNGSQVQRYVWKVHDRYKEFAPDMFR